MKQFYLQDDNDFLEDEGLILGTVLFTCGLVVGAVTALLLKDKLPAVNGKKVLQEVKDIFLEEGPIEGSWIELQPVTVDRFGKDQDVFYGGISRKEDSKLTQYEFIADARTGNILDLYKL